MKEIECTIYPKLYLSIYKAIIMPVPFKEFPERVQSIIAAMHECNLLEIINDIVYQNHKDNLPTDFIDQLKYV